MAQPHLPPRRRCRGRSSSSSSSSARRARRPAAQRRGRQSRLALARGAGRNRGEWGLVRGARCAARLVGEDVSLSRWRRHKGTRGLLFGPVLRPRCAPSTRPQARAAVRARMRRRFWRGGGKRGARCRRAGGRRGRGAREEAVGCQWRARGHKGRTPGGRRRGGRTASAGAGRAVGQAAVRPRRRRRAPGRLRREIASPAWQTRAPGKADGGGGSCDLGKVKNRRGCQRTSIAGMELTKCRQLS